MIGIALGCVRCTLTSKIGGTVGTDPLKSATTKRMKLLSKRAAITASNIAICALGQKIQTLHNRRRCEPEYGRRRVGRRVLSCRFLSGLRQQQASSHLARVDDVAEVLTPILAVDEELGDFLQDQKHTQKYWVA